MAKSQDTTATATCSACGVNGSDEKVTDKLKFRNKRGGTIYIHYKQNDTRESLCRKCWQKNLKLFHDKIDTSLK